MTRPPGWTRWTPGRLTADLRVGVRHLPLPALAPAAAYHRLFELLGVVPGPDLGHAAAAVTLADLPEQRNRALLRELERAHLVRQHVPRGRYRMHDLTRLYAVAQVLDESSREAALRRVVDFYLHTAFRGDQLLSPEREPVDLEPEVPEFSGEPAVLAWFEAEHACLLAAHEIAVARGWHTVVFQLAWTLNTFHYRRGFIHDELAIWQHGLAAAEQTGISRTQALRHIGRAYTGGVGRYEEATGFLERALALAEAEQDLLGLAYCHGNMSMLMAQQG